MNHAQERLKNFGRLDDADIPLAEAALELAQWVEPHLNLAAYKRHLDVLSADVRAYIGPDTHDTAIAIEAARQILARRYGYLDINNTHERADGANLARTIDRRRGNPETLAILYAHVLSPYIQDLQWLALDQHVFVGVPGGSERTLIDPVSGGRTVTARQLRRMLSDNPDTAEALSPFSLTPLSPRQILVRLQDEIKAHHLRHAAPEAAIQALEGALFIAPNVARLWREIGVLHARLDHLLDAAEALKRFLTLPGSDAERYTASQLLQELSKRIEKGEA